MIIPVEFATCMAAFTISGCLLMWRIARHLKANEKAWADLCRAKAAPPACGLEIEHRELLAAEARDGEPT